MLLGFLRVFAVWMGEFTTNAEFDTQRHLSDTDIAVDSYDNPSLLSIMHLKQSKTDQDRVGITLYVCRPNNSSDLPSRSHAKIPCGS